MVSFSAKSNSKLSLSAVRAWRCIWTNVYGQSSILKILHHLSSWLFLSVSNDQLSFIYLTNNIENVRPIRYSLLHIDEAMNVKKLCDNIKLYNNHHILSHIKVSYAICDKQLKYLNMYLS